MVHFSAFSCHFRGTVKDDGPRVFRHLRLFAILLRFLYSNFRQDRWWSLGIQSWLWDSTCPAVHFDRQSLSVLANNEHRPIHNEWTEDFRTLKEPVEISVESLQLYINMWWTVTEFGRYQEILVHRNWWVWVYFWAALPVSWYHWCGIYFSRLSIKNSILLTSLDS